MRHCSGKRGKAMLVLTRKSNQSIMIGDDIEISVLSVMGDKVRIGIQAPRSVPVYRREVYVAIQRERDEDLIGTEAAEEPSELGALGR
jgi:carbon storage regulator